MLCRYERSSLCLGFSTRGRRARRSRGHPQRDDRVESSHFVLCVCAGGITRSSCQLVRHRLGSTGLVTVPQTSLRSGRAANSVMTSTTNVMHAEQTSAENCFRSLDARTFSVALLASSRRLREHKVRGANRLRHFRTLFLIPLLCRKSQNFRRAKGGAPCAALRRGAPRLSNAARSHARLLSFSEPVLKLRHCQCQHNTQRPKGIVSLLDSDWIVSWLAGKKLRHAVFPRGLPPQY